MGTFGPKAYLHWKRGDGRNKTPPKQNIRAGNGPSQSPGSAPARMRHTDRSYGRIGLMTDDSAAPPVSASAASGNVIWFMKALNDTEEVLFTSTAWYKAMAALVKLDGPMRVTASAGSPSSKIATVWFHSVPPPTTHDTTQKSHIHALYIHASRGSSHAQRNAPKLGMSTISPALSKARRRPATVVESNVISTACSCVSLCLRVAVYSARGLLTDIVSDPVGSCVLTKHE
jgi:hypothetical protein